MAKTQDYTKIMQDMMASFPVDAAKFQDAFKSQAAIGEKFSKVALEAAEKSTEVSSKWAKDALTKVGALTKTQEEPADYAKAVNDFASASAELAAENLAAFAEIAKKVQMETVELMMAAGKDLSEEASEAVKKATATATETAKKAAAAK
ncbi:Phasin [Thioclava sp. A2]|uniref:Phasin n=1 Tax=Thioclava sp. FCG-A2 TaxID=3080562 RepID=UPI002952EC4D|nr:Phasin [Thioclava sp. A2]MDV7271332.1 Phasin [Thioclava sp. A2]